MNEQFERENGARFKEELGEQERQARELDEMKKLNRRPWNHFFRAHQWARGFSNLKLLGQRAGARESSAEDRHPRFTILHGRSWPPSDSPPPSSGRPLESSDSPSLLSTLSKPPERTEIGGGGGGSEGGGDDRNGGNSGLGSKDGGASGNEGPL
jgi:hypothetical protein